MRTKLACIEQDVGGIVAAELLRCRRNESLELSLTAPKRGCAEIIHRLELEFARSGQKTGSRTQPDSQ